MKHLLNKTTTKQTFTKILERLHKFLIFSKYLNNLCNKFINYRMHLT